VVTIVEATATTAPPAAPSAASSFTSGLSAAYAPSASQEMALGALETYDASSGSMPSLSLSSLDGSDDTRPAFAPTLASAPAVFRPPAKVTPPAPKDAFSAPGAEEEDLVLALPQAKPKAKPQTLAVEASTPVRASPTPTARPRRVSAETDRVPAPEDKPSLLESPRARFALGMVLALVLGSVPAHLYASHAETRDFASIRLEVVEAQKGDLSLVQWEDLTHVRADALSRMGSARRRIQVSAFVLWLLGGAGVGYLWLRKFS
jgi:hypothetical protein